MKRRMKIVVVGAGATGIQLTQYLVQEGHDVSLIESSEEKARHASNRIDCLVLHGDGNDVETLRNAEISKADALVCVTDSDEMNIIICGLAASIAPEEDNHTNLRKIARVRNNDYKKIEDNIGAEGRKIFGVDCFIHPDIETANAVLNAVAHGALGDIFSFPGTPYELGSVNVKEKSEFDGLRLSDFPSHTDGKDGIITLIKRGDEYFIPTGSTVLQADDLLHFITQKDNMEYFFNLAGRKEYPLKHIGIVGGGRLGALIAQGLFAPATSASSFFQKFIPLGKRDVIIIDKDYLVCKELAADFPDALVLNEDISDENFVAEEKIGNLDLLITSTDNQELNIITAIYLKSKGVKRAIALAPKAGYKSIALQLGVDVSISEQSVVADSIISNLTDGSVRGIHSLGDESIGIVEARVAEDSVACGKVITDFDLSTDKIIMLVVRKSGESFIPRGNYIFQAQDKIILIVKDADVREIEKFFGSNK
jgi:trk system potassium uptake protein TrkA